MARETKEYLVSHHRTIEVTQLVDATSQAEAIRKVKAGEFPADNDGEWLEWDVISDPVAYKARAVNSPGERDG